MTTTIALETSKSLPLAMGLRMILLYLVLAVSEGTAVKQVGARFEQ
jgi:hypothetical protein